MQLSWFVRLQSFVYSLGIHILMVVLLLMSFNFPDKTIKPVNSEINIVKAVSVDQKQVQQQLDKLKRQEAEKKRAEEERIAELERKAEELKQKRINEEKQLKEVEQKKIAEQKRREEEQKKLAEAEKQRKLEEEKKEKIEQEKIQAQKEKDRIEEEKRKAEKEKERIEEEKRLAEEARQKAETEKKRLAAEKALQEQLAEEQAEIQKISDQKLATALGNEIHQKIIRNFNLTGLPNGLSCRLKVNLLPDGDVINATIVESSGNEIFDRRALTAVQKASPLPVPEDLETFERMDFRNLKITFEP